MLFFNGKPELEKIFLVENNPYDRAVIDAALGESKQLALSYNTLSNGRLRQIGPSDVVESEDIPDKTTCLVLFDLALTRRCEEEIPTPEVQTRLTGGNLRALSGALMSHDPADYRALFDLISIASDLPTQRRPWNTYKDKIQSIVGSCKSEVIKSEAEKLLASEGRHPSEQLFANLLVPPRSELKSKKAILDAAEGLSRAPSLWKIFFAVASKPKLCFAVVSHYANDKINDALVQILSFRNPTLDVDVYPNLIFSKSDLGDFAERLTGAHRSWMEKASSAVAFAPFSSCQVHTQGDLRKNDLHLPTFLFRCFDQSLQAGPAGRKGLVLWDETTALVGSGFSQKIWDELPRRVNNSVRNVSSFEELEELSSSSPGKMFDCRLLFTKPIEDSAVTQWANSLNRILGLRKNRFTFVAIAGTEKARESAMLLLGDSVEMYHIKGFRSWSRDEIASVLGTFQIPVNANDEFQGIPIDPASSDHERSFHSLCTSIKKRHRPNSMKDKDWSRAVEKWNRELFDELARFVREDGSTRWGEITQTWMPAILRGIETYPAESAEGLLERLGFVKDGSVMGA